MKKKLNITLLKSFIYSDFLLIEEKKNSKLRASSFSLGKKAIILDPLILLKSLKQYIRLLQFLTNQNDPLLFLFVQNKQFLNFLNYNLKNSCNTLPISLDEMKINSNSSEFTLNQTKMVTLFDSFISTEKLVSKGFNKAFFLINTFNSNIKKNSFGVYKVYNEINSLKKIIFILSIITQVYHNKKK